MKLTTVKSNKQIPIKHVSNVFKLKQMIQLAANSNSHPDKENMPHAGNCSPQQQIDSACGFQRQVKKVPFIVLKNQRCNSETCHPHSSRSDRSITQLTSLNFEKLKVYPLSNINKNDKNFQLKSFNTHSHSQNKRVLSGKKIQGINKSMRTKNFMREQISIQNFVLGKKLGKGRFGNVYAAQQKYTKFLLALKIINKKQLKQPEMQEQLISQIKLQSYMKHPNVLQMYGFFADSQNIYLMLELAQESLFKDLRRKTCYSQKEVAYYTKQILEGLKYLHSQSIIHRDLKPENIMVVNSVIKLADFGWSVYSPFYKRQTFCGTLDYVPPQIVKGDFYDEKVDIWSLGILIFELTFGFAPFEGSNTEEQTFEKIINGQFKIPQNVSEPLRKIIKYILIRDPRHRLNLKDIEQSSWLRSYEKQGRSISCDIWNFWQKLRSI